jgi:hypothetical protein
MRAQANSVRSDLDRQRALILSMSEHLKQNGAIKTTKRARRKKA